MVEFGMPSRRQIALGAGSALAIALALGCSSPGDAPPSQTPPPIAPPVSAAPPSVSALRIADDLPLLPPGIETAARPPEVVRAVYEFAARHPEVLHYVPCFCQCERMGHRGNEDCFVAARNGAGKVTAWEPHGMICEICIDVARTSMQMHNSGASTWAIRDFIEKRYGPTGAGHTPTPMPTRGGGTDR